VTGVNLAAKLALFDEHWSPRTVAEMNGHKVAVVKVLGEFVWHEHAAADDFFLVLSGRLLIDLPDETVELGPGELYVVPRGVQHRPRAEVLTELLLIEPLGTANTGDAPSDRTAPETWI
jgi:mannose-6-phosphate isomerase-like protein (cupin superfamily)